MFQSESMTKLVKDATTIEVVVTIPIPDSYVSPPMYRRVFCVLIRLDSATNQVLLPVGAIQKAEFQTLARKAM